MSRGGDSENVANQTVAPAAPANGAGSEEAVAQVGDTTVKNENGTYDVKEETRGTEARPYTLDELGAMTRAQYAAAQEALDGTMYVAVGNYTYDKNGVLGNGERNDTPGQNPDGSKLNAYGENGYLNEKNDGANGKSIVFVNGSITSGATGYTNIDNIGTSLLLAVPAYTNVTFKGITFNNVMSFNYQLYTSPWSQLGELKFDGCTFNGIIVGAIAAQTLTFNGCTFANYTNTTSANNSNPTWIRPAYGNWTAGDNKGQGDNFQSLTKINFTGNTVTSTRPVKFEYISQWDIRSTVTVTNNSFDISAQEGDTAIKNVGLYLGAHTKTNAFDLVADGNTKSDKTAALYTIPEGETSLPLGSTVTNTNGDQIELTDALKWKAANAAQDKIVLKTVKAVASVGTVNFATLTEAINAAQDGQTVTLLGDVEQNSQLTINKNITLDLNGKTIKNTVDIWGDNTNAILSITNGAKVTITGNGTMDAKENDCYTINVKKGDLTIENGTFYGNVSVVQVEEGTLSVKGGTFDLHQKWEGSSKYLFNCIDDAYASGSANVAVSGGTFVGFDPNVSPEKKVDGKAPSFAAPGAGVTKNENGSFTAAAGMTAQILDKDGNSVKAYTSLQDAVAAANASTEDVTISLRKNITVDHQLVINNAKGKAITLDLNGLTLTSTYAMTDTSSEARYALVNKTTLTVKSGTFAAGEARAIGAYGALTLNGANVTQKLTGGHACVAFCANGKSYTIKNSTIDGAYAVCNFANNSTINITGSTLTGTGNTLYHNGSNYGLKLTVKDTTITSSGSCGVYISGSTSAQSNATNQNGAGGYQQATFTGCTISGAINGVEVKYTDLTLDSCAVSTTAEDASYKQDNNGPAGSGFAVVSTDNAVNNVTPKPEGTIIIKGEGKYIGPVGLGSLKSVKETYADFADETIKVSGGTFTTAVPEMYCAAGYAPSANSDGTYGVKLAEGAYLLQDYRTGDQASWKYPAQPGMAFAGWYKDAEFKTACTASDVEGAAYAKFVPITDLLKFKGGSLRMDVGEPTESTYLRFGYTMAIPENTTYVENGWYYKKVTTSSPDDVRFVAYNNAMNNDGTVTANLVFNNVTANLYNANFTEKAFVKYVTADGTTVEAVESSYQVRSVAGVAAEILNHPMASQKEKEYAAKIRATIQ